MNIVAISSLGPHHRFVLEQLHAAWPLKAILHTTGNPPPRPMSRIAKLRKLVAHPLRAINQRLNDRWYDAHLRRTDGQLERLLFDGSPKTAWDVPCHAVRRDQVNTEESIAFIQACQPDIIVTSGCPLLRPEVFELPRLGTLNIHYGISPAYRGEHTMFWPLYHGDTSNLGVTILQIDAGIDTGPILAQGWPALTSEDTEATLLAKSARLVVRQLITVLDAIEQADAVQGTRPPSKGGHFPRRARAWYHDALYWFRRKTGQHVLPARLTREVYASPVPVAAPAKRQKELT